MKIIPTDDELNTHKNNTTPPDTIDDSIANIILEFKTITDLKTDLTSTLFYLNNNTNLIVIAHKNINDLKNNKTGVTDMVNSKITDITTKLNNKKLVVSRSITKILKEIDNIIEVPEVVPAVVPAVVPQVQAPAEETSVAVVAAVTALTAITDAYKAKETKRIEYFTELKTKINKKTTS